MAAYPPGFLWGVATSAIQVEGAEGRARSIWDTFADRPGAIRDGSTPHVTTDSLHRLDDDLALLAGLGVNTYRFSISWPRVEQSGLSYYDRLVDGLLEREIAPMATFHHWDLPQHVEDDGGWRDPSTAGRFAEYVATAARHLGDRVPRWITLNEPREITMLGHALGVHAPGLQLGFDALPVAHELLRAHGLATLALRAETAGQVGITLSHSPVEPATASPEDREAAHLFDLLNHWLFADPVVTGAYPSDLAGLLPALDPVDGVGAPLDFYGLNYYNPTRVAAPGAGSTVVDGIDVGADMPFAFASIDAPTTDLGWPIVPQGLTAQLLALRDRYGDRLPPVIITENGASLADDAKRVDFLDRHLAALRDAIEQGVDVRGYCHWSLLDNWEWAEGFTARFGLVDVDLPTGTRTPKASYHWYRTHIEGQS